MDKNLVEQARSADVIDFLQKHCGFTFTANRGSYRCEQHPSLAVKGDRLSFYWHSKGVGGYGVLDYLTEVEGMQFRQAVEVVAGTTPTTAPTQPHFGNAQRDNPKILKLPARKGMPLRLYYYLCKKRGIDGDIVSKLIQEKKIYEDPHGNVVFVGHDEQGKPRFASVRGTYTDKGFRWDCAGSDKRYGFNMAACAPSGRLYVFESPIDAMSHATLAILEYGDRTAWEHNRRLSLAGTSDSALPFFLNQHTAVRELVFCLDNDGPGREAADAMARKYAGKGYTAHVEPPRGKDYNEDLAAFLTARTRPERTRKDLIV